MREKSRIRWDKREEGDEERRGEKTEREKETDAETQRHREERESETAEKKGRTIQRDRARRERGGGECLRFPSCYERARPECHRSHCSQSEEKERESSLVFVLFTPSRFSSRLFSSRLFSSYQLHAVVNHRLLRGAAALQNAAVVVYEEKCSESLCLSLLSDSLFLCLFSSYTAMAQHRRKRTQVL